MKHDTFSTHHVWEIRTVVGIDNPDDWKRGDPDTYVVRGVAQFPAGGVDAFSWLSLDPLTAESERFTDERLAMFWHDQVTGRLQEMIDGLRSPDW